MTHKIRIHKTQFYREHRGTVIRRRLKRAVSSIMFLSAIGGLSGIIVYTYPWNDRTMEGTALPYVQGENVYSFDGDFLIASNVPLPPKLPEWRKENDQFLIELENALK